MSAEAYPVVDLFAGPGGLGEGFASYRAASNAPVFRSVVSIEHDEAAHRSLLLRHFFRNFGDDGVPDDYYAYLNDEIPIEELFARHQQEYDEALESARCISLGPDNHELVHDLVSRKLGDCTQWVIVGGPPCQAYSLVGRSRMMGNEGFEDDTRHFLYREYLRLIADHQPPVFVMENVKGLLSAQVRGESMIDRILSDLRNPELATTGEKNDLQYRLYSLGGGGKPLRRSRAP